MDVTSLFLTTVSHARSTPVRHSFRYRSCSWLVDLDQVDARGRAQDLPRWITPLARFRAADHLGNPNRRWRDNIAGFAEDNGIDLTDGQVLALTSSRVLGHVFNPLTLYWCHDAQDRPACVIAEVHNTYGERHAYLVRTDDRSRASADKQLYVSPFNDVSGRYQMSVPEPTDRLHATITLHHGDSGPFVATWRGHRVTSTGDRLRAAYRLPLSTWLVSLQIRWEGIRLWRHLPLQPRPTHQVQELV
ncbi:DUF1365 domain-containing protein [Leekyejoonella antrihumi]|uniref:DUF1365 domain-containing protein n=1 Tax=Leekyejoonella antrihumi TaxID=1660198 RepID=A0A563E2G3_9MICO|nr:DUF1365 domain-containing protein [Leekyejoonella antrihumi]TWP36391.1 DUF1365 domain-containing protein [Leekyejoonella antrihumi]